MSSVSEMADTIKQYLDEYSTLATSEMKEAVKATANATKREIEAAAPRRTGRYAKSWAIKKTKENSNSLALTVHSKTQYRLTHLLEFGHALRNGGRTKGIAHIAPAEAHSATMLEAEIRKRLEGIK